MLNLAATSPTFRFRAFLCYSHRDSDWADWLHGAIEDYPIPPRLVGITTSAGTIPARLAPVFRDRDELPSAADLSATVSDALAQSATLIVICSPHAAQSRWVNEEVKAFQRLGRSDRIFCLIVDGEPGASAWAGREHDECLPPALMRRLDADGRETGERIEPIAADARPGGDGKTNARLKLIAGLLGVGLDDLIERERRRRRSRWMIATGTVLALLCLTTVLSVNAVIARHAAERRQKQAEDLIEFMLGDLDDKLRQVNRLDILESVADKAVKYFASMPLADVNDATLAQGVRALQQIGRVRYDQGRMPDAESAFAAAQPTADELVRRAGGRAEFVTIQARNLLWLGRVAWERGELDAALTRFRSALDRLATLGATQQNEADAMDLAGDVHTNVGRVLEARGDFAAAHAEYLVVLGTYERLSARERDKLNWKAEVGYAHNNLGQIAWKEGHLDEAIREYGADRRIKASLAALEPNNARREDLLISNAILGKSLAAVGETTLADRQIRNAVDEAERLLAIDPTVTSWQEDAGYYSMMLAALARARGNFNDAAHFGDVAVSRMRGLVRQDPQNVIWARELAEAEVESARRLLAQKRYGEAGDLIRTADQGFRPMVKGEPMDRTHALVLARIDIVAGDIAEARNDPAGALRAWQRADATTREFASSSRDPAWVDTRIGALLRLRDIATAQPLLDQLAAMGYRHPDLTATANAHGVVFEPDLEAGRRVALAVATLTDVGGGDAPSAGAGAE
jgi:tetratricopeptide (TPR) repeat protein